MSVTWQFYKCFYLLMGLWFNTNPTTKTFQTADINLPNLIFSPDSTETDWMAFQLLCWRSVTVHVINPLWTLHSSQWMAEFHFTWLWFLALGFFFCASWSAHLQMSSLLGIDLSTNKTIIVFSCLSYSYFGKTKGSHEYVWFALLCVIKLDHCPDVLLQPHF